MSVRGAVHQIRDRAVRMAAQRPFRPILDPSDRIVIVRPDHFGDILMLGPALRVLQRHATRHETVLMAGPWNQSVAAHIAPDTPVVTYPFPGFARGATSDGLTAPYEAIFDAARVLRALRPRAIVLMRDDHWWGAWMAQEAGIPLRFGYANPQVEPFLTHPIEIESEHYVQQNVELIARSLSVIDGGPAPVDKIAPEQYPLGWPTDSASSAAAHTLLEANNIGEGYVAVHAGSGAPVKHWPAERWSEVIDRIHDATGLSVILTGSPDESDLCQKIALNARLDVPNLAGTTTLFVLAEVLRGARLVLGVDSGPLHLATAVDTASIHIYGPSDHVRYGPWGESTCHRVIRSDMTCPSCGNLAASRPEGCGCMMAVTVEQVSDAAIEILTDEK